MKDKLKRMVLSLDMLSKTKDEGILNPVTAQLILLAHRKSDPIREYEQLETAIAFSKMFHSPFPIPDESVDGPIRVALSEKNQPIGIYSEECHFLIAGQTGCGKSTLLKIIFTQVLLMNKENGNVI